MIAKEFTIPRYVKIDDEANVKFSRITVEPFERGYERPWATRCGAFCSLPAGNVPVTAIRVEGISNEFSAIPGVREDVTEFVLNLKKCDLRLNRDEALISRAVSAGGRDHYWGYSRTRSWSMCSTRSTWC